MAVIRFTRNLYRFFPALQTDGVEEDADTVADIMRTEAFPLSTPSKTHETAPSGHRWTTGTGGEALALQG